MERLIALWNRGLLGKLAIGGMGLVVVCCVLGAIVSSGGSSQTALAPTRAPVVAQPIAQQATEKPKPTSTPAPSVMPEPTAIPSPTPTETLESRYLRIAQEDAITVARDDYPSGEWKAVAQNFGDGPETSVTFPLSVGFSNEQTVRLGRVQAAGIIKRLFDAVPELVRVTALGTLPDGPNSAEQGALSIVVDRSLFGRWDGTAENLGEWNISQRLK